MPGTSGRGEHAEAATLYAEAAARWQEFGNVPERAHALLGQGRCLLALGDPAAEQPLRQAAELFSSMGYRWGAVLHESVPDPPGSPTHARLNPRSLRAQAPAGRPTVASD